MCFVLCEYTHSSHAGIYAVRQREINDPILATKIQSGFRAPLGKLVQSGSLTAGQY